MPIFPVKQIRLTTATDSLGNQTTNKYQVATSGSTVNPTYDADGNELTDENGNSYRWDAKNELTAIIYNSGANSGNHTEFSYDAMGHRIAIVERAGTTIGSGTVNSTKQLVWDGNAPVEERNASNTVTKRFYAQGEQISGTSYYYTRDHLDSVREMCNSSGTLISRLDYDPWGRVTVISGTVLPDFQYAGYYAHMPISGSPLDLNLTLYRAYDPNTTRWLSRDPLGEGADATLYSYVWNDPIDLVDPLGLAGGASKNPNGPIGNPNGIDPAQAILASSGFRAGYGAATMGKGMAAMVEGGAMCSTGAGALVGVPLMLGGLYGLFDGADNMIMSAAPPVNGGGGLPIFQTPNSGSAPTGGHK